MFIFTTLPKLKDDGSLGGMRIFQIFRNPYERKELAKAWVSELQKEIKRIETVIAKEAPVASTPKVVELPPQNTFVTEKPKRVFKNTKEMKLVNHLQQNGMITAIKAKELFGIQNISSVVGKLRLKGYKINVIKRDIDNGIDQTFYVLKDNQ
jgi:hypothetical protein